MRRLARDTHVCYIDPETSEYVNIVYKAGEIPDEKHVPHITNPRCWLGEDDHSPGNDPDPEDGLVRDTGDGLQRLTVNQLVRLAADNNVNFPANPKKAALITLLREAGVRNPHGND